jgi:hypothetical protein
VVVGQIAGEHAPQLTRLIRREPKDAQVQLVVPDHVDEVAPANHPARGAQMSRTARPGWLLHLQVAQLAEIERRELLRPRALPVHLGSMPAGGMAKLKGGTNAF